MDQSKFSWAPHTYIPDSFIPAIGRVMVEHAFMDQQLQIGVCILAGMDYSCGVSFLSEVLMTSKRAEIFKNLARTREPDVEKLCKLLVVGDIVVDLSAERNNIAHYLPYWVNGEATEIGYFRDETKTVPQIASKPAYIATVPKLNDLAEKLRKVGFMLAGLQRIRLPDGLNFDGLTAEEFREKLAKYGQESSLWTDTAQFPWQDKLAKKIEKERARPQNKERSKYFPPNS